MRLDKFLKVSRLIKRRTLAKDVCDQGRVEINDRAAKASSNVKIGDKLSIRFGQKIVSVKVEDIKENPRKEEAATLYQVIGEVPVPRDEKEEDDYLRG
ncbi:MAG TPA: RNA-binding S4 domain-containing protein [Candidatus Bathyarchaeia archaeon]|uniref:RNA-binding S4 domain-containing protein n=1 Tax=Brevibacillus migulae TaxID=1644114 RepID=UPI00106DF907|nr:RNA-binding S4 domain-containing protein [Brevibacillus migulae]HZG16810.1 RNA-binding S4 domain-containing protein [Candidatus Bathyarchaeia archaeon]